MECIIYSLVDPSGHVYVKDGAVSHSEVAESFGLDLDACDTYRFDLSTRRLLVDRGRPASDRAAHAYCDEHVGSPEKLMDFAAEGHLTNQILGSLLDAPEEPLMRAGLEYHKACGAAWRILFESPQHRTAAWTH